MLFELAGCNGKARGSQWADAQVPADNWVQAQQMVTRQQQQKDETVKRKAQPKGSSTRVYYQWRWVPQFLFIEGSLVHCTIFCVLQFASARQQVSLSRSQHWACRHMGRRVLPAYLLLPSLFSGLKCSQLDCAGALQGRGVYSEEVLNKTVISTQWMVYCSCEMPDGKSGCSKHTCVNKINQDTRIKGMS